MRRIRRVFVNILKVILLIYISLFFIALLDDAISKIVNPSHKSEIIRKPKK